MTQRDHIPYREIPLGGGLVALVDSEDYDRLGIYRWHALRSPHTTYAKREIWNHCEREYRLLHREVMDAPPGIEVDHRNGNGLDCRKENLRTATRSQQNQNKRGWAASGYKGVYPQSRSTRWQARIKFAERYTSLGTFDTPEEAARAYDAAAREHFGEFARLNFPD
jgi:hypothetical protein